MIAVTDTEGMLYLFEQQLLSVHKKPESILVYGDDRLVNYLISRGYNAKLFTPFYWLSYERYQTAIVRCETESGLLKKVKRISRDLLVGGLLATNCGNSAVENVNDMTRMDKQISALGFKYLTHAGNTLFFINEGKTNG